MTSPQQTSVKGPKGQTLTKNRRLSDRELLEALRPVVLKNGHECIGEHAKDFLPRVRAAEPRPSVKAFSPLRRAKSEHRTIYRAGCGSLRAQQHRLVHTANLLSRDGL